MELISGLAFHKISEWSLCNRYPQKFNSQNIKENDKVFINLDNYNEFLNILKQNPPKNKFILITHNSDKVFTNSHFINIKSFVNKVYAINNICDNPNVYTIPIGFRDYPIYTSKILQKIKNDNQNDYKKNIFMYMNFTVNTNYEKRENCLITFCNKPWITSEFNIKIEDFYLQIAKSKYVLSPEGTGIDCHRIYESIYFDTIPIIKTTYMDNFYKSLPIIIVQDWSKVTEEEFNERYDEYFNKLKKWKNDNPGWEFAEYWCK